MRSAAAVVVIALVVVGLRLVGAAAAAPPTFSDVPPDHPFHADITWMAVEAITTGYADGTFRPSAPVTRQAMSAFMHRFSDVLGGPTATSTPSFSDVPPGHPFAADIAWMAHHGITTGYPDGTFRPDAPVTRQAMSAFMHRFSDVLGGPTETSTPSFSDVPPGHPFAADIAWMAHHGITTGYPDGTFRPSAPVTRQAMSAFMFRLAEVLGGSDSVCVDQDQISVAECRGLQAIYDATVGPSWHAASGWLVTTTPCAWTGVVCQATSVTTTEPGAPPPPYQVVEVQLAGNGLAGPVPSQVRNLVHLEVLDLFGNALVGSLPPELGQLSALRTLDLDGNALTGAVPAALGDLAMLDGLYLGGNQLSGPIPAELGQLDQLVTLSLYGNALTGPIPATLGGLDALVSLDLDGNQLAGTVPPALGGMASLRFLSLDGNDLTGAIPPGLAGATELRYLALDGNALSGPVPLALMALTHLVTLDLHGNGCLTAATDTLADWLTAFDPAWSDGCPAP